MNKVGLIAITLLLFAGTVKGQKVKYKDIYGLLSTKQYEAAEPFLRKYLKENIDNPNAYLYMGIILNEKAEKEDILRKTSRATQLMDSSIFYYNKAYGMITEKELKRNDEYYLIYNRRDLRTGEFGVKLSDVQFDIEKKMEGLRERVDRVKMVKHYFALADSLYKKSATLYKNIKAQYPNERALYLRSDEALLKKLTTLGVRFDSCLKAFDMYKGSLATLGKNNYNQTLTLKTIGDIAKDGSTVADFYTNDISAWNYKDFAEQSKQVIVKEVAPMNEHLVLYDVEINKLRDRLQRDSVSVKSDLTSLIDKLLMEQLKKFDNEPLPMEVFSLKIAELEYRSTKLENKKFTDSLNVHGQLERLMKETHVLARLDSLAGKLSSANIDKKAEDYTYFIDHTYRNTVVLKSYINATKDYASRERKTLDRKLLKRTESLRWLVSAPDSIPLFKEAKRSKFKPLGITEEKYTSGIFYKDSLNAEGYFYLITASRIPDVKIKFPVDKMNFRPSRLAQAKSITFSDAGGQIFFVLLYCEKATKDNKISATLAKIYKSDGLAWSSNYQLAFVPKELAFKQDTGEVLIKADASQTVVDKNGKILK